MTATKRARLIVRGLAVALLAAAAVGSPTAARASTPGGSLSTDVPAYADTIMMNAHVYTANVKQPEADVVAIRGEDIVYVGSGDGSAWRQYVGPKTRVIDLEGRTVRP